MNHPQESPFARPAFITTRWTQVMRARGDSHTARTALGELCEAYYAPVLAFIRQGGRNEETARDLTQEFFARLLAGHGLEKADPGKGRFRSFLLGAVKHFLADQYDRQRAAKRGSGQAPLPLTSNPGRTTITLQIPDPQATVPDTYFDREWALTVVKRALDTLAAQQAATGKHDQFETLKPWLVGEVASLSQADAAQRLGMSEGAVKVAIHRLRRQFRDWVKNEIAHTVQDPAQLQEELRYLVAVLSRHDSV